MYIIYIYISCMIDDVGITFTLINPKRGWFFSPPGWHGAELQHGCAGDRGVVFWAQIGRLKYSQDPSRIHPYISDIGAIDSHGFRQKKDRPSVAAETLKRRERDTIGFPGRPGETRSILRSHRNLSGTTGDHYATKIGWPIFSHLRHFMTF